MALTMLSGKSTVEFREEVDVESTLLLWTCRAPNAALNLRAKPKLRPEKVLLVVIVATNHNIV